MDVPTGEPILEAVEVTKEYETRSVTTRALDRLSLRIQAGVFCISTTIGAS